MKIWLERDFDFELMLKKLSLARRSSENTPLPWPSDGFNIIHHDGSYVDSMQKRVGINIVYKDQTSKHYHRILLLKIYTQYLFFHTLCRHYLMTWHLFLPFLSSHRLC